MAQYSTVMRVVASFQIDQHIPIPPRTPLSHFPQDLQVNMDLCAHEISCHLKYFVQ